ncbi:apolipoprotein N-acyltransferase [Mycobacterium tuberculosis]
MPRRCRPGRGAQRVGGSRSGAVINRWAVRGRCWVHRNGASPALASASLGGVWLTSFLLVATNTANASVLVPGTGRPAGRAGMRDWVCGTRPGFLHNMANTLERGLVGSEMCIRARVQAGDIADAAARLAAGEEFTAAVADQRPDLVVWGESSVGQDLTRHPDVLARLAELSQRVGADLLVNVDAPAPDGGIYKSAVLVGAHEAVGSYRKTRLVPFGEYVPLRPLFGWITRYSKAAAKDRQRGAGPVVLAVNSLHIAPLISYEMTFSDLTRHAARLGAALLVYQSSTSTFQGSWAQPQLAAQPAVRAVEAGIPAVHASLSGDSSAFDTRGRRLAWCSAEFNGAIVVNVPLASNVTLYLRLGDWVPVTAFVVMGAGFAVFLRRSLARVSDCADK